MGDQLLTGREQSGTDQTNELVFVLQPGVDSAGCLQGAKAALAVTVQVESAEVLPTNGATLTVFSAAQMVVHVLDPLNGRATFAELFDIVRECGKERG